MRYVMLLWFGDDVVEGSGEPGTPAEYADVKRRLEDDGVFLAGQALHPPDITTTIRVRNDQVLSTDGPFVEVAEHLAGFYLCECRDLDHAMAVAATIPGARHGAVEVRPVWDYEAELDQG